MINTSGRLARLTCILLFVALAAPLAARPPKDDPLTKDERKAFKKAYRTAKKKLGRVKLKPPAASELQFAACAPLDETDERELVLNKGKRRGTVTLLDSKFEPDLPRDWSSDLPTDGSKIKRKGQTAIEITFKPQEPRVSMAKLTLTFKYSLSSGKKTAVLMLYGDGTKCPVTEGDDSGVYAPETDPDVLIGAGKTLGKPKKTIEICIAPHLPKPEDWDKMNDRQKKQVRENRQKQIDAAVAEANAIWTANRGGIKFKAKPFTYDTEADPHCLDVYFDPRSAKGSGKTTAKPINVDNLDDPPDGLNEEYGKKLHMGERIDGALRGTAGESGRTLAHELGHALGLGMGPTADDHREVDGYDKKVKDAAGADKRLCRHENPGKELREIEVELARQVAKHLNKTTPKCGKAIKKEVGHFYVPDDERGDVDYALIIGRPDTLEVRAAMTTPLPASQPVSVFLEIDTDNDRVADHLVSYSWDGLDRWSGETSPALSGGVVVQHLWNAAADRADPEIPEARAISVEFGRALLSRRQGNIGWRIRVETPEFGASETIPLEGLAVFDITPPSIQISLDAGFEALEAQPGDDLMLRGAIAVSSTFSGRVEFEVGLESDEFSVELPGGTLIEPIGASWDVSVRLPSGLAAGEYRVTVRAVCELCRLEAEAAARLFVSP